MKDTYLHLIACLLLLTGSGGRTMGQGSAKPDTLFKAPYVDIDEWRDKPVRHHYVHGGFRGTDTRFSFLVLLSPKAQHQGRFFQYITPVPDNENLSQGATGAYTFVKPGTYFSTLRAVSQRQGDAKTPFARIQNLGRVRIVVRSLVHPALNPNSF